MKTPSKLAVMALAAFTAVACDIDQTEEGDLPDVDVEVEGGELPEYDVDAADIDVGTTQDTLVIDRPTVDVDMPDDTTDMN